MFSVNATLDGSALASASGTPSFFDSFSKYGKTHRLYTYFGCPHWATLDYPRERQKSKNERHAAWERFPKMQNERRAARERVFCPHGPDWCPQKGPKKMSQTVYFKLFWRLLEAHWSTRIAHAKKWSSPSGRQRVPIASAQSIDFSDEF